MHETKKNREHGFQFLALAFIPVFHPKKVGALKLCVRNKLEPKQHTQVYEIRVCYIYYVDVQYQKEKKLFLCNFFGASNFLTVLHRTSYPKRSLLLLHKVGGWQPVLAFGISKRYCTYEVFNISKGPARLQMYQPL